MPNISATKNALTVSNSTTSVNGVKEINFPGATVTATSENVASVRVPVLLGPYTLDYTDILHNADRKDLFTPNVGDVILTWWTDPETWVGFDGDCVMGQGTGWTVTDPGSDNKGPLGQAAHGADNPSPSCAMMTESGSYQNKVDTSGNTTYSTLWKVTTPGPVQVENSGGSDLVSGHGDYYFLVQPAS